MDNQKEIEDMMKNLGVDFEEILKNKRINI